jgi:5-methylcytosine-specific restriction protein A
VEDTEKLDVDLQQEFDAVFTGEDGLQGMLSSIRSEVKIVKESGIDLEDIRYPEFKKSARADTIGGLSGLVTKYGILNPIHILKLEDDDSYMVLDGLRRIYSALRNNIETVDAYVWYFSDIDEGKAKANLISLLLNRSQLYTPKELWSMLQILEGVNNFTPGTIEFLLQMQLGDAMKLKDVMLSDVEYDEIKEKLMNGETTIDAAYKKIMNMRKKEDRLAKDDMKDLEVTEEGEFATSQKTRLDIDEVKELLEMIEDSDDEVDIEDLNRTLEVRGFNVQDTDDRRTVPREIKQGTFIRDEFTCQVCRVVGGAEYLAVLVYHHVIPVSAGGPDTIENGLTLCQNCHMLLHTYITGDFVADVKTLPEEKQKKFARMMKWGNFAIDAYKRIGLKKKSEFKEKDGQVRHAFPMENLRENRELFKTAT